MSTPATPATAATRIARHLLRISHQHFFKTFDDWLALAVNAFLRDDLTYLEIIQRYGPRTAPWVKRIIQPTTLPAHSVSGWVP